jgi:hypothetical protein
MVRAANPGGGYSRISTNSNNLVHCFASDNCAKPVIAINLEHCRGRSCDFDSRSWIDGALTQAFYIFWQPHNAVRVYSSEVGVNQTISNDFRVCPRHASALKGSDAKRF